MRHFLKITGIKHNQWISKKFLRQILSCKRSQHALGFKGAKKMIKWYNDKIKEDKKVKET